MQEEDDREIDEERDIEVDIGTMLLFDEADERVLAALRILGVGRSLEEVDRPAIALMARVPEMALDRCFDIVKRARLFEGGDLHDEVVKYLKTRALIRAKGASRRGRR